MSHEKLPDGWVQWGGTWTKDYGERDDDGSAVIHTCTKGFLGMHSTHLIAGNKASEVASDIDALHAAELEAAKRRVTG